MNSGILLMLASIAYLVAAVLYGNMLIGSTSSRPRVRLILGRSSALLGVIMHAASIGLRCMTTHHAPMSSAADLLAATGWGVAIGALIIDAIQRDRRVTALGAVAFSATFLCVFSSSVLRLALPSNDQLVGKLDSAIVSLHVVAVLFAFAFLFLAVASASIYLFEHSLLKHKKVVGGLFSKLPPLTTLDKISLSMVTHAFPLLTIGCIAGIIRAYAAHVPLTDMHTLMSVATWAILGIYLLMRIYAIGTGVRANYVLLVGLFTAVLTYLFHHHIQHIS